MSILQTDIKFIPGVGPKRAEILNKEIGQLDIDCWRSYRSILFALDEDGLASDLLYNSPNMNIRLLPGNFLFFLFLGSIIKIGFSINSGMFFNISIVMSG